MYLPAALSLLASLTTINGGLLSIKRDINLRARDGFDPSTSTFVCMFMTNEPGLEGETQNLCEVGGVCAGQLPDGLTANVSSAGPTEGQTCFLYSGTDCTGDTSAPIVYPGYDDLSVIGFDKKAVSWRCWKMCGYTVDSSSSASEFTVTPTIGAPPTTSTTPLAPSPSSLSSDTDSVTFTFSPASSSPQGTVQARQIETTTSSTVRSITTTITGSLIESSTWKNPAPFDSTEVVRARQIETTLSSSNTKRSITTSLTGSQPGGGETSTSTSTSTSTWENPAPFDSTSIEVAASSPAITSVDTTTSSPVITSVDSTTFNPVPTSVDNTTFPLAGSTTLSTSIINTNTPGFSMSSSSVTITHTFADGSTTVITTAVIEPVPTVPTGSTPA